jgi:tRNA-dihydrouridine synthase
VHGRTRKMMSNGPALWDEIGKAVIVRNQTGSSAVIIGNGDVCSYTEALERIQQFDVDGVMVGTGVFKNPWMFNKYPVEIDIAQRISLMRKHITLYRNTWGNGKDYNVLKRFFKIYLNGFNGAAHWRDRFMRANGFDEALALLDEFENNAAI